MIDGVDERELVDTGDLDLDFRSLFSLGDALLITLFLLELLLLLFVLLLLLVCSLIRLLVLSLLILVALLLRLELDTGDLDLDLGGSIFVSSNFSVGLSAGLAQVLFILIELDVFVLIVKFNFGFKLIEGIFGLIVVSVTGDGCLGMLDLVVVFVSILIIGNFSNNEDGNSVFGVEFVLDD